MSTTIRRYIYLAIVLALCVLVYWPGLQGDYVFDDVSNILDNQQVAITSLDLGSLRAAFYSGDAGPLGRPISMLSFAINHYFTGFNPYYFKVTNLFIHLLNGVVVFWLCGSVLKGLGFSKDKCYAGAVMVMAGWMLHPLNLTSVLYVVQRMTSLSALFGFLALACYSHVRANGFAKPRLYYVAVSLVVFALLALSAYSKESGLLFVPLIFLIELLVFRGVGFLGGRNGTAEKALWMVAIAGIAAFLAMAFLLADPAHFSRRDFSLYERLLTETRVVFYYIKLIFYPTLSDLSLYHDDFVISTSLLEPLSTFFSLIGLMFLTFICFMLLGYSRVPLLCWGWFVISHLMESTFFSLELVHEHRNYFASFGLVFFLVFLVLICRFNIRKLLIGWFFLFVVALGFVTWQRSMVWSNLVDHSVFEASVRDKSDRANYQLARVYIKLVESTGDIKYADYAKNALSLSRGSYNPGHGAWFTELHLAYYLGAEPDENIVSELKTRLYEKPFYNGTVGFMSGFVDCQLNGSCKMPHHEAVEMLAISIDNPTATPRLRAEVYKLLAKYFIGAAGDLEKGEEFLLDAIRENPDVNGFILLAQTYRMWDKLDKAALALKQAEVLDKNGVWSEAIENELGILSASYISAG